MKRLIRSALLLSGLELHRSIDPSRGWRFELTPDRQADVRQVFDAVARQVG